MWRSSISFINFINCQGSLKRRPYEYSTISSNTSLPTVPLTSSSFRPQKPQFAPHLTKVGIDERKESANTSVNTRLASLSTAITPGNDTNELAGRRIDEGATRVTLAGVLTTGSNTGTDHVVSDLGNAVVVAASGARDDGNIDLAESGGRGTILGQSTPASNSGGGT